VNNPSAFEIGRTAGNNVAGAFVKQRDNSAIETILSQAMETQDPAVVQNSIGKILSQVSPERQGAAVQYLSNVYNSLQQKQTLARERADIERKRQDEQAAGITPGIHPTVQAQQLKDRNKNTRLSQYGLGGDVPSNGQADPSTPPTNVPDHIPGATKMISRPPQASFLDKMNKQQLTVLTGHPDREISEPAKAQLEVIKNNEKIAQGQKDAVFKSNLARADKFKEKVDELSATLPQKESALKSMEDAVATRNLSYFSPDNLAEVTGIEGFRSPEGAIFKTAGKEYFLGNIARAGARPNQWVEQQISDMMPKIGRSIEANLSVARAFRNELDLDKEKVRLTEEISDKLISEGDLSQAKLSSMVDKQLAQYAEKKQIELFNDLRAIKAIGENTPQKFRKVEKDTPISAVVAQALLRQFDNDPKKAAQEATKLGYSYE